MLKAFSEPLRSHFRFRIPISWVLGENGHEGFSWEGMERGSCFFLKVFWFLWKLSELFSIFLGAFF